MSWRSDIQKLSADVSFSGTASEAELAAAERHLGIALPMSLRELLSETDGVLGEYDLPLIWTLSRIVEDNLHFRANANFKTLYMPFDCLLFFSDGGNGDQFAFAIQNGEVRRSDIFVWNHEDDSRTWVASNLKSFLTGWITGTLNI